MVKLIELGCRLGGEQDIVSVETCAVGPQGQVQDGG